MTELLGNPQARFFLFGAGPRPKRLYRDGLLFDALTGQRLAEWGVRDEEIDPAGYAVRLVTASGKRIEIREDEAGLRLTRDGAVEVLSEAPVRLPDFAGHPHRDLLRVLHHEIVVNLVEGRPTPNLFVYPRPWYRDAAMTAMVLKATGNLGLIRDWVLSLEELYDRNNGGDCEPDNLGQLLYLIGLVGERDHPLIARILEEARRLDRGGYVSGRTDGGEHPVYQTCWLKLGLRTLGLPDERVVPRVEDSYAGLCWWMLSPEDAGRAHFQGTDGGRRYPYLAWAEAHALRLPPPMDLVGASYPLTWESGASQANYEGMSLVDPAFTAQRTCAPHTWHAAEMFLYLTDPSLARDAG